MLRIHMPLLIIATALYAAPSVAQARDAEDSVGLVYSPSIESRLQREKVRAAALEYQKAHSQYIAGSCSVRDVIAASINQLRVELQFGPDNHAAQYHHRISDLLAIVRSNLERGVATQHELDEVLNARLDVIVSKSVLVPAE